YVEVHQGHVAELVDREGGDPDQQHVALEFRPLVLLGVLAICLHFFCAHDSSESETCDGQVRRELQDGPAPCGMTGLRGPEIVSGWPRVCRTGWPRSARGRLDRDNRRSAAF